MIFRPELARLIRAGRKTRPAGPPRSSPSAATSPARATPFSPAAARSATCRIHVTTSAGRRVGDIAYADARAEGFQTTEDFKAPGSRSTTRRGSSTSTPCSTRPRTTTASVLDRDLWIMRRSLDMFERRHAHKPVWVITFRLDVDPWPVPRPTVRRAVHEQPGARVAPRARSGRPGRAEAHHRGRRHARPSSGGPVEQLHRDRDRVLLSREDQIVRLRRAARLRGIDATRELWALEKMRDTSTADGFVAKVRKTEAKVFQIAA
jgi:hypothetical protein